MAKERSAGGHEWGWTMYWLSMMYLARGVNLQKGRNIDSRSDIWVHTKIAILSLLMRGERWAVLASTQMSWREAVFRPCARIGKPLVLRMSRKHCWSMVIILTLRIRLNFQILPRSFWCNKNYLIFEKVKYYFRNNQFNIPNLPRFHGALKRAMPTFLTKPSKRPIR